MCSTAESTPIVVELSLCGDDSDIEESKLYGEDICSLTGASKVAILKAYMLNKQMNWLRTVMHDTFEEGIHNWCLPLNHNIPVQSYGAPFWSNIEFANV